MALQSTHGRVTTGTTWRWSDFAGLVPTRCTQKLATRPCMRYNAFGADAVHVHEHCQADACAVHDHGHDPDHGHDHGMVTIMIKHMLMMVMV